MLPRAVVGVVFAIGTCGCVAPPDDEPIGFEDEPVTLRSEQGRAIARVTLTGDSIVRGENAFSVELVPVAAGASAELVGASAFMLAHGHGTIEPEVGKGNGSYFVHDLVLYMAGRWEITFQLSVAGAGDTVTFPVDVP
jgi:hypothetical protein